MKKMIFTLLVFMSSSFVVQAGEGIIDVPSQFTVDETADRLENILIDKGMLIFKRINHSESAEKVAIKLRNTQLIIFGNPKVGSMLMLCQQSIAIDLPLKALIWEDDKGKAWISYNDIKYLEQRHKVTGCDATISKMTKALAKITLQAASQ